MSLIETKRGRKYFRKAESLILVPYVYDDSRFVEDYVLGDVVYDISAIIGDSIMLEQGDGEVEEKFNEFVRSPLVRNVSAISYGFTAQCLDLQDIVLKSLFDAYTASGSDGSSPGITALQDDYPLMYAMVRIRFRDENLSDIILPKVQMSNKLMFQQMKTRGSQGNVSGIALSREVAVEDNGASTPALFRFKSSTVGSDTFVPLTPVLFVPREFTPMVLHHKDEYDGYKYYFSSVDFSTGTVSHNTVVNIEDGSYEKLS